MTTGTTADHLRRLPLVSVDEAAIDMSSAGGRLTIVDYNPYMGTPEIPYDE